MPGLADLIQNFLRPTSQAPIVGAYGPATDAALGQATNFLTPIGLVQGRTLEDVSKEIGIDNSTPLY